MITADRGHFVVNEVCRALGHQTTATHAAQIFIYIPRNQLIRFASKLNEVKGEEEWISRDTHAHGLRHSIGAEFS